MVDQKELTEKYLELQILEQQIKQVNQQLLGLDNQLLELQRLDENLSELANTKKNTELLVALGGGIFTKAELKDNNTVLVNVGANVVVEKNIPSSKSIISNHIEQVKEAVKQLEQEFQIMAANIQETQQALQNLTYEMKEAKQ